MAEGCRGRTQGSARHRKRLAKPPQKQVKADCTYLPSGLAEGTTTRSGANFAKNPSIPERRAFNSPHQSSSSNPNNLFLGVTLSTSV